MQFEEEISAVPKFLKEYASARGYAILVTDYYLSRRQRVHFAYIPGTETWYAERDIDDPIDWLMEQGHDTILVVPGTRKRHPYYFEIQVTELRKTPGGRISDSGRASTSLDAPHSPQ